MAPDTTAVRRRRVLQSLAALGAVGATGKTATANDETRVRLLHDTHFHGRFENSETETIATYFGLIEARRDEQTIALGSGDDIAMSLYSSVFEGEHMIEALNASGLDYNTYGNHEFDFGPEMLAERVEESDMPWVSANVIDTRTDEVFGAEGGAERYVLHELDGATVGITGLCTLDTPDVSSPGENVEFLDPAEAMEAVIPEMREAGADVIVVMSHLASPVAEEVAAAVDGINVMAGDHASQVYDEPAEINDTICSFVGDEFEFLGEIDLTIENGEVTGYDFTMHDVDEAITAGEADPHPAVADVMATYEAELDDELDVEIGQTAVSLDARRETVRASESNLGNFIADAKREEMDADVAIMNGGSIRSDTVYDSGVLTRRVVADVLPFPNQVVAVEIDGATLRETLEHGVGAAEESHGRFPQVSGMAYGYDPDAPTGERISFVTIDGADLDPDATYTLATNDFLTGGGDGYEMLEALDGAASEGPQLTALILDRIEAAGCISPEIEGRIEVLD